MLILYLVYEDTYPDECSITVMATGIGEPAAAKASPFGMGAAKKSFSYNATPSSAAPKNDFTRKSPVSHAQGTVEEKPIKIPEFLQNK